MKAKSKTKIVKDSSKIPVLKEPKPLEEFVPETVKVEKPDDVENLSQLDLPNKQVELPIEEKVSVMSDVPEVESLPELNLAKPLSEIEVSKLSDVVIADRCKWCVRIGIFVVCLMIVVGAIWGYSQLNREVKPSSEQLEVPSSATPSPSPVASEIEPVYAVWNGSGVTGAAGALADKLKAAGRDVSETKNAPAQVTGSQVEVVTELDSQRSLIEAELLEMGVEVASWKSDLPSDLGYNVRLILGK